MIRASIIIPTFNRAKSLALALQSLVLQDFSSSEYEILIVDNGSTDDTKKVTDVAISNNSAHNIKYIFEPEPGLLSGRHRGAFEAEGEILIFVDDDIEAVKGWISAIIKAFEDSSVHLIGGPSLPKFEVEPPEWIKRYCNIKEGRIICVRLSLLNIGDEKCEIDPLYVWGLNYAIRKKTLFDLGGFHPDCIPKHLQHFQGDGETGLSLKVKEKGLRTLHIPEAMVYHNIPKERLTVSYFKQHFYYHGVADSFTQIRQNKGLKNIRTPICRTDDPDLSDISVYEQYKHIIDQQFNKAYIDGFIFHQEAVKKSKTLLKWVLRENYFDYKLPDLSPDSQNIDSNLTAGLTSLLQEKTKIRYPYPPNLSTAQIISQQAVEFCERADMLISQGDIQSALKLLDEAMYLSPEVQNIQQLRIFCLEKLGRNNEAAIVRKSVLKEQMLKGYRPKPEFSDNQLPRMVWKPGYPSNPRLSAIEAEYVHRGRIPWTPGYQEAKMHFIHDVLTNSSLLDIFEKNGELPDKFGFGFDERCVEYPWVFSRLRDVRERLLDAGSILNYEYFINNLIINKKIDILTLAPESNCFWHKGVSYFFGDLRDISTRDNYYDTILCMSTLEHVGLDNTQYTGSQQNVEQRPTDYLKVLPELRRVLKPGGRLFISVPYGKYINFGSFQQFDAQLVKLTLDAFEPEWSEETYFHYTADGWCLSSAQDCEKAEYVQWTALPPNQRQSPFPNEPDHAAAARAVACLLLAKPTA